MSERGRALVLWVVVVAGFVVHAAIGSYLTIGPSRPNLALTALLTASLFARANSASAFGLVTGLLEGAYTSINVGTFAVSRTIVAFAVGAMDERIFRESFTVELPVVIAGSLSADALFYLFAPQPAPGQFFICAILGCVYNAICSIPIFILLRRILGRKPIM